MRRHADFAELGKNVLRNAIVKHTLALDERVLLVVKGRGVVLEVLNERARLRPFIQHFGLAFVNATPLVHCASPLTILKLCAWWPDQSAACSHLSTAWRRPDP